MVYRVYICSYQESSFVVQQYDQLESCNTYNHIMSRSPSIAIKKHVKFSEGKQYWLLPNLSSNKAQIKDSLLLRRG